MIFLSKSFTQYVLSSIDVSIHVKNRKANIFVPILYNHCNKTRITHKRMYISIDNPIYNISGKVYPIGYLYMNKEFYDNKQIYL